MLLVLGLAVILSLSGCVSGPRPAPPATSGAQHLTALQAADHFELRGRLAASNGQDGFSAGLRWQQEYGEASIDLSAPLGFGAAHIEQSRNTLMVTTSKGVTLNNAAASDQLRAILGFDPPWTSLRYWMLGASDPASSAQQSFDAQQRLLQLQQGGWQVDYAQYILVGQLWLPQRVTLTHQSLRLRVAVDSWHL